MRRICPAGRTFSGSKFLIEDKVDQRDWGEGWEGRQQGGGGSEKCRAQAVETSGRLGCRRLIDVEGGRTLKQSRDAAHNRVTSRTGAG